MAFADKYLKKQTFQKITISRAPNNTGLLKYIVVIPAYCEPDIFITLESLLNTNRNNFCAEVYILVNYSINCSEELKEQNDKLYTQLTTWAEQHSSSNIEFIPLLAKNLPAKHAGVGLARKILMDFACERFNKLNNSDGFICSLDADTIVPRNYFAATELTLNTSNSQCLIFNFHHPIEGSIYSEKVYRAICLYEMHLRYYKAILCQSGFPHYHFTVGSCFAVEAGTYAKVGGMSKRKAGEDFYFLQKIFPVSETSYLNDVILTPSPRPSWRVPFGTGPTVKKIASAFNQYYETYNPLFFSEIEAFINSIPLLHKAQEYNSVLQKLPQLIKSFLANNNIEERLVEIKNNSSTEKAFTKRLLHWFDAFMVIKFLNFAREATGDTCDIVRATKIFLNSEETDPKKLLLALRTLS